MTRRKFTKQPSKYEKDAIRIISTIQDIEIQNQEINGKFKTVFYCKSNKLSNGRMCVIWGRTTFNIGDEINMKGRLKDEVFLVWQYLYTPANRKITEKI